MNAPTTPPPASRQGISAAVLTALFVIVAGLLFYAIYLAFPQNHEFTALLIIGSLALVFALGCYLAESISRDPMAQRSLAWAFLAMGFATLFLTVGLGPTYNVETTLGMLTGLIILIVLLMVTIALIAWRIRRSTRPRTGRSRDSLAHRGARLGTSPTPRPTLRASPPRPRSPPAGNVPPPSGGK